MILATPDYRLTIVHWLQRFSYRLRHSYSTPGTLATYVYSQTYLRIVMHYCGTNQWKLSTYLVNFAWKRTSEPDSHFRYFLCVVGRGGWEPNLIPRRFLSDVLRPYNSHPKW